MNKTAECVRNVANWSQSERSHLLDSSSFDVATFESLIPHAGPKLQALLDHIDQLDAQDMKQHNIKFKHMIYTDVKAAPYGSKLIASALVAKGYHHIYDKSFTLDVATLESSTIGSKNFATLCSTTIFGKPLGVKFRKKILSLFNERPDNIHGEKLRFIILDQGFKEGIDLFDVKYVHLFDPLVTQADEKQAVGRSTRFCGQKGLEFDPKLGWPLYVYRYEVDIPDDLQNPLESSTMFDLFLKKSGLNMRKIVFANALEQLATYGAVDADLNKNVHSFQQPLEDDNVSTKSIFDQLPTKGLRSLFHLVDGGARKKKKTLRPNAPRTKKIFQKMKEYIQERFQKFTWPEATMENQCVATTELKNKRRENTQSEPVQKVQAITPLERLATIGGKANMVAFTPTQDFVRYYFTPTSAYKGMLLWHSVGAGKTCTAIATATSGFEPRGYSILWVTRHTLKADIWKNMFQQVCSLVLKKQNIPEDAIQHPMRNLSKNWLQPISFKQFSNALAGKNDLYHELVKRNGKEDPLRKTLIIIDEAHKLFATDVSQTERPNVPVIFDRIHDSYDISKEDSARVLLMTATPYTSDPMQLIQLLNLLRTRKEAIPEDFDLFTDQYLTSSGTFTSKGTQRFLDEITGYISYLNRAKDARQFAVPQFKNIHVSLSRSNRKIKEKERKTLLAQIQDHEASMQVGKNALRVAKDKMKSELAQKLERCKQLPKGQKIPCSRAERDNMKRFEESLLHDLNAKVSQDEEKLKKQKQIAKALAKDMKDQKSDHSQEAALSTRCKLDLPASNEI